MAYYAYYDPETRVVRGFYHSDIHPRIPEPNIELTYEEWQDALTGQRIVVNGKLEPYNPPTVEPTSSQIAAALQRQRVMIDQASIAPLRTLVLDLARGMTLPEAAEAARVELQTLEEGYHANV